MKQKHRMPTGEIVEKEMPQWKTPWNHDTNFESDRTAFYSDAPSLTKQEFKEECDINTILQRFTRTGEPPPIVLPEHFADLTQRTTYFDMARSAAEANVLFYTLPANLRAEFLNDPARWADAVVAAVDTNDRETLNALGVATKPLQSGTLGTPPPAATPAPAASQAPSGAGKEGAPPPTPPTDSPK